MFLCPYLTCPTVVPCGACVAPWHPHLGKIDGIDCMSARWTRSVETMNQWTWTKWTASTCDPLPTEIFLPLRWGKKFCSKEGCLHSVLSYVFISFSCIFIFSSMLIYQFTRKNTSLDYQRCMSGGWAFKATSKLKRHGDKVPLEKDVMRVVLVLLSCVQKQRCDRRSQTCQKKSIQLGFVQRRRMSKMLTCQRETTRTISVAQPYSICIKMSVDGQGDDHGQLFHEVLAYPGGLSRHNQWKYHEIGSQLFFFSQRCFNAYLADIGVLLMAQMDAKWSWQHFASTSSSLSLFVPFIFLWI